MSGPGQTQSTQADVLAYLEHFADRFDLKEDIQLETWVTDARWDERHQRWVVDTDAGERVAARFWSVRWVRCLSQICPIIRAFMILQVRSTTRWPHEPVSFENKRVGVIETGSSGTDAYQIAKRAAGDCLSTHSAVLVACAQSPWSGGSWIAIARIGIHFVTRCIRAVVGRLRSCAVMRAITPRMNDRPSTKHFGQRGHAPLSTASSLY